MEPSESPNLAHLENETNEVICESKTNLLTIITNKARETKEKGEKALLANVPKGRGN